MNIPLLITTPTNIRYLTGFTGAAPEEREAYCLLAQNDLYLFTNALYIESAINIKSQISNLKQNKIQILEISRENPFAIELSRVLKSLPLQGSTFKGVNKLGFEENSLTVLEYNKLTRELKGITLIPTQNRVEEMRMIKRDDEIASIKKAAQITDQCYDFILKKIQPGVTESDIAWEIESFFRKHGATTAFSPIVAFGKNSSQPHYNPYSITKKPFDSPSLKNNDVILLDFGARVNGYCADMTRVVFIGKPKDEWIRAYHSVLEAQKKALLAMKKCYHVPLHDSKSVSISGAALDRAARKHIEDAGFSPYPHSLGHGVGLDIHESPRLSVKNDELLTPGMVCTVEPGVYVEGQYGIRIEDLVFLRNDGIEILSKSNKDVLLL